MEVRSRSAEKQAIFLWTHYVAIIGGLPKTQRRGFRGFSRKCESFPFGWVRKVYRPAPTIARCTLKTLEKRKVKIHETSSNFIHVFGGAWIFALSNFYSIAVEIYIYTGCAACEIRPPVQP